MIVGKRVVAPGESCYVIAEIGINHNGSVDLAKQLIRAAADAGCDAVKFQKRTVLVIYTDQELRAPRASPFGTTNGDLKYGLEFEFAEYTSIDSFCKSIDMPWFVSAWDEASVHFIRHFDPPAYKIASASLTDDGLLRYTRRTGKPVFASTGMSTLSEIDHAVATLGKHDLVLMQSTSTYPARDELLNLRAIPVLAERYGLPVGYSGHETGIATSIAAFALGACCIERHITLDRTMWGSDQAASLEPDEFSRLVRDLRACERAMGDGIKQVYEEEVPIMRKLRRVGSHY